MCWILRSEKDAYKSDRSHRELSNEHEEEKSSTQREVTLELFFSRDGELRDIQEEFSEYVRYVVRSLVQIFIFSVSFQVPFSQYIFRTRSLLQRGFTCKNRRRYNRVP